MQKHWLDLGVRAHNARSVITSVRSGTTLEITTIFSTVTTTVTPGPSSTRTSLSIQTDAQRVQTSESFSASSAPNSTIFGTPSASTSSSRQKKASALTSQAAFPISTSIGIIAVTSSSSSSRVVGSTTFRTQATPTFVKAGPLDDASITITSPDSISTSIPTSTSSSIPISSAAAHRHVPTGAIIAMCVVLATIGTLAFFVCRLRTRRKARRDQNARRWWNRTSRHYEDSLVAASPLPRAPDSPTYPHPPNESSNTISVPPMAEFGARRGGEGTAFILNGGLSQADSRSSASMYSMSSQGDSFVDDVTQPSPSPMSVRPFSDSEAFTFPKPPPSQHGSDPSSSSRSLLKLSVPPSPNTPRPPTMVYIPPIPPLPKSPPPPVPVSLVTRNPFADPQPLLSLSPNRVPPALSR